MKYKFSLTILGVFLCLGMLVYPVQASEVLNPYEGDAFNIGESVHISGYITLDEDLEAARVIFYAESESLEETIEITQKYYTFSKDVPAAFSQINKGTLTWTIPSDIGVSSDWTINVKVIKNTVTIKELSSDYFEITDKFHITAGANSNLFNLGHELVLGGTFLNVRRQPIEGVAEIYIEEENYGLVFSAKPPVINGYVEYTYEFKETDPAGKYTVLIEVEDGAGNSDSFSLTDITVSDSLIIDSIPKKTELNPGETVIITGTVRNVRGKSVPEAQIDGYLTVSDEDKAVKYSEVTDSNGKFAFEFKLPEKAPPGKYPFEINTADSYGNTGRDEHILNVGRVREAEIILKVNKSTVYQEEVMNITYILKNTGNVDLTGQIELYLDNEKIKSDEFSIRRNSEKTIEDSWKAEGEAGTHEIYASLIIDDEEMFSSEKITIELLEHEKPFDFEITRTLRLIIYAIIIGVVIAYLKRRNIKEYFWHKEFKKKTGKTEKSIFPE